MVVRGFRGLAAWREDAGEAHLGYVRRPGLAAAVYAVTAGYVLLLSARIVHYSEASFVFVLVAGLLMSRFSKKSIPILLIIAAIMGYGGQYVFTHVFYVDLP